MRRLFPPCASLPIPRVSVLLLTLALVAGLAGSAAAQGVTTGSLNGVVTDEKQQPVAGASIIAIHVPSGTNYETTTRADGRYQIIGMRVGGPYSVTASYSGTGTAFEPKTADDITIYLGVATDLNLAVTAIAVQ